MLVVISIILSVPVIAQQLSENGDTLITTNGMKFYHELNLKLGTGTLPSGDFKFITTSQQSWANMMASNPSAVESVGRKWSGHTFIIKKIRKEGSRKILVEIFDKFFF